MFTVCICMAMVHEVASIWLDTFSQHNIAGTYLLLATPAYYSFRKVLVGSKLILIVMRTQIRIHIPTKPANLRKQNFKIMNAIFWLLCFLSLFFYSHLLSSKSHSLQFFCFHGSRSRYFECFLEFHRSWRLLACISPYIRLRVCLCSHPCFHFMYVFFFQFLQVIHFIRIFRIYVFHFSVFSFVCKPKPNQVLKMEWCTYILTHMARYIFYKYIMCAACVMFVRLSVCCR